MQCLKLTPKGAVVDVDRIRLILPVSNIVSDTPFVILGSGIMEVVKGGKKSRPPFVLNTRFETLPSNVSNLEDVVTSGGSSVIVPELYKLLTYEKGDYFIFFEREVSISDGKLPFVADIDNVEYVFNNALYGNSNNHIPYEQQLPLLLNAVENNVPLPVSLSVYEAFVSKLFVSASNVKKDYRLVKDGKYIPIATKEKARAENSFSGITSQDAKTSVIIAMDNKNKNEAPSEKYSLM